MGYGYDDLNRLTTVTGGQSQSFGYDALGNMTSNSQVGAYGYGDSLHKHAVTTAGGNTFAYDANGNMTSGAGRAMSWNSDNQLVSVTKDGLTTSNAYDYAGERVKRTTANGSKLFFSKLAEQEQGVLTKHYYAGNLRVATNKAGTKTFYHSSYNFV